MYKIYWSLENSEVTGKEVADLEEALTTVNDLRREGFRFVAMASENPDQVGAMGVDTVKDGKLPDGTAYTWKKRRI